MKRTDEQYAMEHGEYLSTSAESFMEQHNHAMAAHDRGEDHDSDGMSDAWRNLQLSIYEFRKRAARAGHEPSAVKFNR
jgi:hypothetical protein